MSRLDIRSPSSASIDLSEYAKLDSSNQPFNDGISNSLNTFDRQAFDSTGTLSIDWDTRNLLDSSFGQYSLDWENRFLKDALNLISLDWNSRQLRNSSGVIVFDWELMQFTNLTTDGFLKTTGGDGTIGIDTNTYLTGSDVPTNLDYSEVSFIIDGGASSYSTGSKAHVRIPYNITVTDWEISSIDGVSGSTVIDIQSSSYGSLFSFSSIAGSNKPTLTAQTKNTQSGLSWSLSTGDYLRPNVESVSGLNKVYIVLKGIRS